MAIHFLQFSPQCTITPFYASHIFFAFTKYNYFPLFFSFFFPIFHEDHWFLFIVALQDGYFVFLDSFFDEDDMYQKEARSLVVSCH